MRVFFSRQAIVIGLTPPGTGVIAPEMVMPTSIIVAPVSTGIMIFMRPVVGQYRILNALV